MPITVHMPALSPTMVDGTLARWHVGKGDTVASGDILAEIETDKAIMEFEAVDEGTVVKLLVDEGATHVPVNSPIAIILEEGEEPPDRLEVDAPPDDASSPATSAPQATAPGTGPLTATAPARPGTASGRAELPERRGSDRVFSSPLARRLARENGLDLAAIAGTGPAGRVIKRDIEAAIKRQPAAKPEPVTTGAGEWQMVAAL